MVLVFVLLAVSPSAGAWAAATGEASAWQCNSLLHPLVKVEGVRVPADFMPLIETPRLLLGAFISGDGKLNPNNPGRLSVLLKTDLKPVGSIWINNWGDSAHLPLVFDSNTQARGVGTEAKFAALKYAFEVLGVNQVHAIVASDNGASLALHAKLGFEDFDPPEQVRSTRSLRLTYARFLGLQAPLSEYPTPLHFFKPRTKSIRVNVRIWDRPGDAKAYLKFLDRQFRRDLSGHGLVKGESIDAWVENYTRKFKGSLSQVPDDGWPRRGEVQHSLWLPLAEAAILRELQPDGWIGSLMPTMRADGPEPILRALDKFGIQESDSEPLRPSASLSKLIAEISNKLSSMTTYEMQTAVAPKADEEP